MGAAARAAVVRATADAASGPDQPAVVMPSIGPTGPEPPHFEPYQPDPQSALMEPPPPAAASGEVIRVELEIPTEEPDPEPAPRFHREHEGDDYPGCGLAAVENAAGATGMQEIDMS